MSKRAASREQVVIKMHPHVIDCKHRTESQIEHSRGPRPRNKTTYTLSRSCAHSAMVALDGPSFLLPPALPGAGGGPPAAGLLGASSSSKLPRFGVGGGDAAAAGTAGGTAADGIGLFGGTASSGAADSLPVAANSCFSSPSTFDRSATVSTPTFSANAAATALCINASSAFTIAAAGVALAPATSSSFASASRITSRNAFCSSLNRPAIRSRSASERSLPPCLKRPLHVLGELRCLQRRVLSPPSIACVSVPTELVSFRSSALTAPSTL